MSEIFQPAPKPGRRAGRIDYSLAAIPKAGRKRVSRAKYLALCRRVIERDGHRCVACGQSQGLTPHHVLRRARGGSDTMENLASVCVACHDLLDTDRLCLLPDWRKEL